MAKTVSVRLQVQDENLDEVRRKLEAFGATVTKVGAARADGLQRQLESLEGRLDPAARAAQRLTKDTDLLNRALAAGAVSADRHAKMLADLQRSATAAARATAAANDNLGRTTGTTARQMQIMNAAAINSFQSLASGAPVMQTLVTQGAQLVGAFGGISAAALVVGGGVAVASGGLVSLARAAIEAGDAMTQAEGRLRAATGSTAAASEVYDELYRLALRTGTAVSESAGQFVRFRIAGNAVGATNAEVIKLVETVQKFGIVSGASTSEAQAGAMQLAQALASGKLQGDELRSILENMPTLAQAIAQELGVPIGKLREMGEAGELTAERIFRAILDAKEKADEQFAQMPLTVERASSIMGASWGRFSAEIDRSLGLSQSLAGIIDRIAKGIDAVTGAIQKDLPRDIIAKLEQQRELLANMPEMQLTPDGRPVNPLVYEQRKQQIEQIQRQIEAAQELALQEDLLTAVRRDAEAAAVAKAKAEAALLAKTDAYKNALKRLHPEEEARAKRDEKRAAINAALEAGLIRNEDGTIDLARAQRDLAAVEQEYQDALKKGEGPKARRIAQTAEETDRVAAYIATLRRATDHIGEDSRTRAINEAVAKGQALAIEKGTLLTDDQIATIRRLSAARYDDEAATRAQAAAQKEMERHAEAVAKALPDIFDRAFDRIGDGLVDMALEGKDAFKSLQNIGKAVASSLIADFAKLAMVDLRRMIGFARAGDIGLSDLFGSTAPTAVPGKPVTIGGQTYVPAGGGGTGSTSMFGGGNGLGGIDRLAAGWSPGTFAMPYNSLPQTLQSGIDDVGQLGYTTTANSTLPFSAGEFMTGVGSIVSAVNAFQAFSQGRIGSGVGSTISAGLGIASLAGVALGPLGPIGMIAAPIIGGLLDGLFAKKPSAKEGGSTINLSTGAETIGGQTGKKFSQANRAAASDLSNAIYDMYGEISDLAGGLKLTKDIFVGVTETGIRAQYNGPNTERTFGKDDQGVKDLTAWFAGVFTKELKSGFEEPVQRAIDNIQWDTLEKGLEKLQFALDFGDTMDNLAGNFSLDNAARKQAKDSVKQTTKAFKDLLDTTEQLWPSVRQGGTTVTQTTRELTSMPAAEAISKGLIRQVDSYIGEGMNETVWQDLAGNIVSVASDLSGAVSLWQDVTKTVTEGGEAVKSAELTRAEAAIRQRVNLLIAGTPEKTVTGGEATVAAAKARWDLPTITPLLEAAGYAGAELAQKAAEGLRNELAKASRANDQGQMSRYLSLGGVDLSSGATAAAQYATAVRDVTALYEAGAARTAELAQEQALLNATLLASVGLGEPVSALSVPVADFTAALGLTAAAVGPVTAGLNAMQTAAETGTQSQQTLTDTANHFANLLANDVVSADQYAAAIGRVTAQMREAVAVTEAQRQGRAAVMATLMPAWRPSTEDVMAQAGLHNDVLLVNTVAGLGVSLASMLDTVRSKAADGTLAVSDVTDAWAILDDTLRAGGITAGQYGAFIQDITTQYDAARAMEDARRSGMVSIAQTVDPAYQPSADVALSGLHVAPAAIVALRDSLDGLYASARAGTLAASDLYAAETQVRAQMTAGAITADQYTAVVGLITQAWQNSSSTAQAAAQAVAASEQAAAQAVAASEQAIGRIRTENAQAAIQALQEQVTAQEQASSRWTAIATRLKTANDGLLTGDLSPLNPAARREEARRQAEEAVKAARAGDASAAEQVPELVQTFLQASRALNATGTAYAADFAWGREAMAGLETEAQRQARTADAQLGVLRQSLATEQAMLQALQQPSTTDLAPVLAGLDAGNLGSVVEWARRQGADTLQAVLSTADSRLGIGGNPYRYSATAADIQRINGRMTDADYLTVGRRIGFTGQLPEFNAWVVARGKAAEYEAAVRAFGVEHGYAAGTPSAVPGWSWVGEGAGPELMRMRGGEQVIPNAQAVSMARAWEEAARRPLPANDRGRPAAPGDGRADGGLRAELREANRRIAELTRTVDRMARMLGDQGADSLALQRDIADNGRAAAARAGRKLV